ncbi:unnamed protein product [Acanthosepion pharaonis]|uniref:Uncharacterized protein n=1 Tax=Acanthosepion pharaonis TaxID=158019 RepID=A0A812DSH2_ACAPH|nr:unnamed protein product [Sepia pharaonis]
MHFFHWPPSFFLKYATIAKVAGEMSPPIDIHHHVFGFPSRKTSYIFISLEDPSICFSASPCLVAFLSLLSRGISPFTSLAIASRRRFNSVSGESRFLHPIHTTLRLQYSLALQAIPNYIAFLSTAITLSPFKLSHQVTTTPTRPTHLFSLVLLTFRCTGACWGHPTSSVSSWGGLFTTCIYSFPFFLINRNTPDVRLEFSSLLRIRTDCVPFLTTESSEKQIIQSLFLSFFLCFGFVYSPWCRTPILTRSFSQSPDIKVLFFFLVLFYPVAHQNDTLLHATFVTPTQTI